jgi:hypothetical protein
MPLDDLAMMANTPVTDTPTRLDRASGEQPAPESEKAKNDADIGKAAAGETMPPPKEECEECEDTPAERVARRGQDPPDPEKV